MNDKIYLEDLMLDLDWCGPTPAPKQKRGASMMKSPQNNWESGGSYMAPIKINNGREILRLLLTS